MAFKNDKCKCFSCLYLLTHYKDGKDRFGNDKIKIYCMIGKCIHEKINNRGGKNNELQRTILQRNQKEIK